MADNSDLVECYAIKYATDRVPPVMVAAKHPLIKQLVMYEFSNPNDVVERQVLIRSEFCLEPEDMPGFVALSKLALEGEISG
jgi:hypothetical protein